MLYNHVMRLMFFRILAFAVVLSVFAILSVGITQAQEATEEPTPITVYAIIITATPTDTPEPTEGPSPTPTETPTSTPDLLYEATVEIDGIGQDVAFSYVADIGDIGVILMLGFIATLLGVSMMIHKQR